MWHAKPSVVASRRISATSRDLPMPGSPRTWTTVPAPPVTQACMTAESWANSPARPTNGVAAPASPPATSAFNRHAVTGRSMPLIESASSIVHVASRAIAP